MEKVHHGEVARRSLTVLLILAAASCTEAPRAPELTSAATPEPPRPAGWQRLPSSPLTRRHSAHAFWTGSEVLVLGGRTPSTCLVDWHCVPDETPPFRDGASFDPASASWEKIAEAPIPLGDMQGVVLGSTLYVWLFGWEPAPGVRRALLAYDTVEDRWERLPLPPMSRGLHLVATDSWVVGVRGSHERRDLPDVAFDPSTRTWTELPRDPLGPAYDRVMVWTGSELILIGTPLLADPPPDEPSGYRAAAFDPVTQSWRTLPDPEIAGGYPIWFWAGGRVVNPSTGLADGGETDPYDRPYPNGAMLDPTASAWEPLPDPPEGYGPYRDLIAGGGEFAVSTWGWVLHVPTGTWTRLTRPFRGGRYQGEAVVWAGDRLIAWGGIRWDGPEYEVLNEGWAWLPGTG